MEKLSVPKDKTVIHMTVYIVEIALYKYLAALSLVYDYKILQGFFPSHPVFTFRELTPSVLNLLPANVYWMRHSKLSLDINSKPKYVPRDL